MKQPQPQPKPLSDNPRTKEVPKYRLISPNTLDKDSNENSEQNNSQSIQQLESEQTD